MTKNIITKLKDELVRESFRKYPNPRKISYLNEQIEIQLYKNQIR